VDVAVAPTGRVYVADRGGLDASQNELPGRIAIYSARLQRVARFAPQNANGLPVLPRPIAVMVEPDGTLLVADASYPRLLHFTANGEPLEDVLLAAAAAEVAGGSVVLGALEHAYGHRMPRFIVGACAPPRPSDDGGERLAEVHRALRLLGLRLGRKFAACGAVLSRIYDGGTPGVTWHRVEVDADLPDGTRLTVETATADDPALLDPATATVTWDAPRGADGLPIPFQSDVADQLAQSPPGRFLRARITFTSDGLATPSLRSVRILYPRVSYLDLLPRAFLRDPDAALFLQHFLALFELVFTQIEDRRDDFSREINPDAAPLDVIDWLAALIDLSFDPSWPVERRRALVAEAMSLYRNRGTVAGLERYIEIYTGVKPVIQESFLRRPSQPSFLGLTGCVIGCGFQLRPCDEKQTAEEQLLNDFAHRFSVNVYVDDDCDVDVVLPVVDRIVTVNKPAHTVHTLCAVQPDAQVGLQSTLGIDFVVGGARAPAMQLGGCPVPDAPAEGTAGGILGLDTVLGERRGQYVRPLGTRL
jgi:phage tail-like protein